MTGNYNAHRVHEGQLNAMASHVADHFGLAPIAYKFHADSGSEWTPAITTEDLTQAFKKALKRRRGTLVTPHPTLINEDGEAESADVLRVSDVNEMLNIIFVMLARSIALQQASRTAMDNAVALCQLFGISADTI